MATKQIKLRVSETGAKQTAQSFGGLDKSIANVAKSAMKMAAGFFAAQGVISGLKNALNAAGEQELAERKLATALGYTSQALLENAAALQKVSTFGDEAIIGQQAFLASLQFTEDEIKSIIPVALDLASATGITLESAVRNISKTYGGLTGELGELIPQLKDLTVTQLKSGEAVELISKMYEGQAAAAADTYSGKIQQMKNAIGDTSEAIGFMLTPALGAIAEKMTDAQAAIQDFITNVDISETLKNAARNIGKWTEALIATWGAVFDYLPDLARVAWQKIVGDGPGILQKLWNWIAEQTKVLWQPMVISAQIAWKHIEIMALDMWQAIGNTFTTSINKINEKWQAITIAAQVAVKNVEYFFEKMGANIANFVIDGINLSVDAFNYLADSWVGTKLGINPLTKKDMIDTDGMAEDFETEIERIKNTINTNPVELKEMLDFSGLTDTINNEIGALQAELMETKFIDLFIGDNDIQTAEEFTEALKQIWREYAAQILVYNDNIGQSDDKLTKNTKRNTDQRIQYWTAEQMKQTQALSSALTSLGQANQVMRGSADATKALMYGGAIINTFAAANAAIAPPPMGFGPTPVGFAVMASAIATGMANVAQISAQNFASGGIVQGNSYTGDRVTANVNSGEMILNTQQQKQLFDVANGRGSGGGITINVQGNLVASDEEADRFAKIIEERSRKGFNAIAIQ